MTRADLLAMPAAFADFNGFYGRYEQFVITNPIHMLWALAITALAVVSLLAWGVVRVLRRRSPRSEEHTSALQSLMRISYAVFCLKKKKTDTYNNNTDHE